MVGLCIFPSLLSSDVQLAFLDKLLHRELSNPQHNTNVHLFHHMRYPSSTGANGSASASFFAMDPYGYLQPKDPGVHKTMSVRRMLERKLRWLLLGGQYDWTSKVYTQGTPPAFPTDVSRLLKAFFPDVEAEAAIINFYTPGDTLSVHRDVSEDCDRGLISISLGCDGIFLIGDDAVDTHTTVRLRSGDVVLMAGESRFAWHAIPKILPGTCPEWLESWPAGQHDNAYEQWRGWMKTKRVNINVRQMRDLST